MVVWSCLWGRISARRSWYGLQELRKANTASKTWPTSGLFLCSGKKDGRQRHQSRRPFWLRRRAASSARRYWPKASPARSSRSPQSTRSISAQCSNGSVMHVSYCWEKRPTALRNSIGCASASHVSLSSRKDFASSRSRATGLTPRGSTITCGTLSIRRPNGPRLPVSQPGCGATTRCAISSTGCASTMPRARM